MLSIIRNCSHFSHVHTAIELNEIGGPTFVVRKTFAPDGVKALITEYENLSWYCRKVGINPKRNITKFYHNQSFGILKFRYHHGEQGDFRSPISKNFPKIMNLIDHYTSIFCQGDQVHVHGDLSLGNVLFDQNKVKWIIDWENANRLMPKAYDLIYCITENCLFLYTENMRLSKIDVSAYSYLLDEIDKRIGIASSIKRNPVRWCRQVAMDYASKTGVQFQKVPFIACDEMILDQLNSLLIQ